MAPLPTVAAYIENFRVASSESESLNFGGDNLKCQSSVLRSGGRARGRIETPSSMGISILYFLFELLWLVGTLAK